MGRGKKSSNSAKFLKNGAASARPVSAAPGHAPRSDAAPGVQVGFHTMYGASFISHLYVYLINSCCFPADVRSSASSAVQEGRVQCIAALFSMPCVWGLSTSTASIAAVKARLGRVFRWLSDAVPARSVFRRV